MKIVVIIAIILSISFKVKGQDCNTLDSLNSFHSLKFGSVIPERLLKICFFHNAYFLELDSLKGDNKKQFSDLFHFMNETFSTLAIETTSSKEIYSIQLWSSLDFMDSIDISNNKFPAKYNSLYYKLISIFGKITRTEENNTPVVSEFTGIKHEYIWECQNIRLGLSIRYGAKDNYLNQFGIKITERNIEKTQVLKKLR